MKEFFIKLNHFFRNLLLEDVDKEPDGLPKYHKKFGSKKDPVKRIEKRYKDQQKGH
jgi:hypothetical protein